MVKGEPCYSWQGLFISQRFQASGRLYSLPL